MIFANRKILIYTLNAEKNMSQNTTVIRRVICIMGWFFLASGFIAEICIFTYHRATFTIFSMSTKNFIGQTLSEGDAKALWAIGQVSLAFARSSLYAVLTTCLGGVFLFVSQRTPKKQRNKENI